MKKVSAIITTHNRIELLKKAIDSVCKQTYSNIECIVVDDNSNDGTYEWINELIKYNKNIKYIRISSKSKSGGGYARNLGIREATGDYVAFLDDDDEWMQDKIEKQVKIIEKYRDVGIVLCARRIEYNFGQLYIDEKCIDEGIQDYSKKILYNIIGVTSMMMFRKDVFENVGMFDENLKFWQEYDLTIRICQKYKVFFMNEFLLLYRVNYSDKNRKSNKFDEWLKTTDYIKEKYGNLIKDLSDEEKRKLELLIYNDAVNRCSISNNKKMKRTYLRKIFLIEPSLKNLIKFLFNIDRVFLLKFKLRSSNKKLNLGKKDR